jgi:hypothetical protein
LVTLVVKDVELVKIEQPLRYGATLVRLLEQVLDTAA